MNATDRTPIVLALVIDIFRERERGAWSHLADGLFAAIRHTVVADLWPPTGHDEAAARWVAAVLLGEEPREARDGADCLVVATAVSRRLADVAVSLRVRGDAWKDEAFALWDAASRLSGFEAVRHRVAQNFVDETADLRRERDEARASLENMRRIADKRLRHLQDVVDERDEARAEIERLKGAERYGGRLVDSMAETMEARAEVERLTRAHAEEVARLTEQLATARADLEEALRSTTSAGPVTSAGEAEATDTRKPEPWYAIRNTILRAGARDCVVCHTSAGVVLRVNLGDSLTLGTVQDLIADAGRARGSYKIIVSGTIERG